MINTHFANKRAQTYHYSPNPEERNLQVKSLEVIPEFQEQVDPETGKLLPLVTS